LHAGDAGVQSPAQLEALLGWAQRLLRSARQYEADAAAQLLYMLFEKYTCKLGWRIQLYPVIAVSLPAAHVTQPSGACSSLAMRWGRMPALCLPSG
jgi:hypothetical protein